MMHSSVLVATEALLAKGGMHPAPVSRGPAPYRKPWPADTRARGRWRVISTGGGVILGESVKAVSSVRQRHRERQVRTEQAKKNHIKHQNIAAKHTTHSYAQIEMNRDVSNIYLRYQKMKSQKKERRPTTFPASVVSRPSYVSMACLLAYASRDRTEDLSRDFDEIKRPLIDP